MLKKLGLVTVGVTAGLMVAAPLASAHESHGDDDCRHVAADGESNIGIVDCNTIDQGNGEGNTFNGVENPALPPLPDVQDVLDQLPELGGLANGIPTNIAIPGIPA